MRVLVTGATGLVGSTLLPVLQKAGHDVYALSRSASRIDANLPVGRRIGADLAAGWLSSVLPAELDAVVHLAQAEDYRGFPDAAPGIFQVNVASTAVLLDHARRVGARAFLLASTGGLYRASDEPITEDGPIALTGPLEFYLRSRRIAEEIAEGYRGLMRVLSMRFFFVYGRGQREAMLFPRLCSSIRSSTPIRLDGDEGVRLNPIHVDDAVAAISAALSTAVEGVLNVAGAETLSLKQVATILGQAIGAAPRFETDPSRRPESRIGSIQKMRALHVPTIRLADRAHELV